MTFPLYTVRLQVLLAMEELIPHERLMEEDQLVEFTANMGQAAFVSHQWVTPEHPDPEFVQMRVFQEALKNMMSRGEWIYTDFATELNPHGRNLDLRVLRSKDLFFWYDFFSIPQLDKLNSFRSLSLSSFNSTDKAIESIPAYIERCESCRKPPH